MNEKMKLLGIICLVLPLSYIVGVHTSLFWIEPSPKIEYVYDTKIEYVNETVYVNQSNITLSLEIPPNRTLSVYDNHTQNEIHIEQQAIHGVDFQMDNDTIAINLGKFPNDMRLNDLHMNLSVSFYANIYFDIKKGTIDAPENMDHSFENLLFDSGNDMFRLDTLTYHETNLIFEANEYYWLTIMHDTDKIIVNANNNDTNALIMNKTTEEWEPLGITPAYILKLQNLSAPEDILLIESHCNIGLKTLRFVTETIINYSGLAFETKFLDSWTFVNWEEGIPYFDSYYSAQTVITDQNLTFYFLGFRLFDLNNGIDVYTHFYPTESTSFFFEVNGTYTMRIGEIRMFIQNLYTTTFEADLIVNNGDPIILSFTNPVPK